MIVITLLHPSKSAPVQSWVFETESELTLGRGSQNDVVLYSAVVSRRHAQLQQIDEGWEIVNFGANGTTVDGKVLTKELEKIPVYDGTIVRLGETGPKIRIRIGAVDPSTLGKIVRRKPVNPSNSEAATPPKTRSTFLTLQSEQSSRDSSESTDIN